MQVRMSEATDGHSGKALLCVFSPLHLRTPRPAAAPGNSRGKQDRPLVRPETLTLGLLARAAVQRLRDVARNGPATAAAIELPWDPFVVMAQQTIVLQKKLISEVASRESASITGHRVDLSGITGMLHVEHQPPSLQALWDAIRFIGIGEHCSEGNGQLVSFS